MVIEEYTQDEKDYMYYPCTECGTKSISFKITFGTKRKYCVYLCSTCISRLVYRLNNTLIKGE